MADTGGFGFESALSYAEPAGLVTGFPNLSALEQDVPCDFLAERVSDIWCHTGGLQFGRSSGDVASAECSVSLCDRIRGPLDRDFGVLR